MNYSNDRIQFLRDTLLFFGVKFKVVPFVKTSAPLAGEEDEEEDENPSIPIVEGRGTGEVVVSCVGIGYSNVNKSMA